MNLKRLQPLLDDLSREFDLRHISPDPVELVHGYADPADQEVAGLLASSLAYGSVRQILRSARVVLAALGPSPRATVESLTPRAALDRLEGFRHRFNSAVDLARLLVMIREMLRRHGTLGAAFAKGYSAEHDHIGPALERFVREMLAVRCPELDRAEEHPAARSAVDFLLPLPSRGSACKRLNLYLRWMVRPADGVDFGLWTGISPSKLIIPLDTHVARIARNVGLTNRASADWKTALNVTESLKRLDPSDPVRYDFAISRLGILGFCRKGGETGECARCKLAGVCASARKPPRNSQ